MCAKWVPTLTEPRTFVHWVLKEEHSHKTLGQSVADIGRMANLACPRSRPAM